MSRKPEWFAPTLQERLRAANAELERTCAALAEARETIKRQNRDRGVLESKLAAMIDMNTKQARGGRYAGNKTAAWALGEALAEAREQLRQFQHIMDAATTDRAETAERELAEAREQIARLEGERAVWGDTAYAERQEHVARIAALERGVAALWGALNAAQKISAAALNFVRAKHEQSEDFEDDLRLCVEVQHKAALAPVLAATADLVPKETPT